MTTRLQLPRDPASVHTARRLCGRVLAEAGVPAGVIPDLELALGEACANAVRHAQGVDQYQVDITIEGGWAVATVADGGVGFCVGPPSSWRPADALDEQGRGLPLMRGLVDVLEVTSVPGRGTTVRLAMELPGGGTESGDVGTEPEEHRVPFGPT